MHLYLRSADFTTEVPGIGLKDGCQPVIGSQSISTPGDELLPQIEPAIWFKVQVIDAVSIDCTKRAIQWNSATVFNNELAQICEGSSDSEQSESGSDKSGECKTESCDTDEKSQRSSTNSSRTSQSVPVQERGSTNRLLRKQSSRSSGLSRKRISESMYIGGECYGYQSDLDELFDTAQKLLSDYAEGNISNRSMNEIIFKLLHCYILPAIKLTGDDLAKVIGAYKLQEGAVDIVDGDIINKNIEIERLQDAMKTQRMKHFVPELSVDSKLIKYHPDFAKLLQKHIERDISHSWDSFESTQDVVEKAKNDNDPELEAKRTERNNHFKKYEGLLSARENLRYLLSRMQPGKRRSRLSRTFKPKANDVRKDSTGELDPLQSVYIGMEQEITQRLEEFQALADRKLLVISVKEAIRITIKELQSGDDTFGIDTDKTGRIKATDVLRHSNIPKGWQTLSEQVSSIISDPQHPLGHKHQQFCQTVQKQCSALNNEKQLFFVCNPNAEEPQAAHNSQLLESNVSVQKVLDISQEADTHSVSGSPQFRISAENKISNSSQDSSDWSKSSKHSSKCSKRSSKSSKHSSLADFDTVSDHVSLPPQHIIDTLPQNTKGIACFALPFRSSSKSKLKPVLSRSFDEEPTGSIPRSTDSPLSKSCDGKTGYRISDDPNDSYIIVHDSEQDFSRKMMSQLKESIHHHMQDVCGNLQKELHYPDDAYYRKIWLCYETLFYEEMMLPLVSLYESVFSSVSQSLEELVPSLTVDDLDIGSSIVVHMLQDQRGSLDTTIGSEPDRSEGDATTGANSNTHASVTSISLEVSDSPGSPRKLGTCNSYPYPPKALEAEFQGQLVQNFKSLDIQEESDLTVPTAVKLKTIKIHHPSMVTVLYDRRTWPLPQRFVPLTDSLDCGIDSLGTIGEEAEEERWWDDSASIPQSPILLRSPGIKQIMFKADFKERFSVAFDSLEGAVTEKSPLLKLQHLTRCLREISEQVGTFHKQIGSEAIGACTDELIDFLVVVLCNCRSELAGKLYPHIMLLTDLMPPFFEGGPYSFSLVQFNVALGFIQERLVMKRRNS